MLASILSMANWKNEDDIKAELRAMTDELRRVREGLRDMVSPPKPDTSRAFLHRQTLRAPSQPPPAAAADHNRTPRKSQPKAKTRPRKKPR